MKTQLGMSLGRSEGTQCDGSAFDCLSPHCRAGCSRPGPWQLFGNVWILVNKQFRTVGQDEVAHRRHQ